MKLTFKNNELVVGINFLQSLELKGSDSRHRSKFVKKLKLALEDYSESQQALVDEFGLKDDDGNFKTNQDGDILLVPEMIKEYKVESVKLANEAVVIEAGTYVNNFKHVPEILENYDGILEGKNAEIYDRILDEFDKEEE